MGSFAFPRVSPVPFPGLGPKCPHSVLLGRSLLPGLFLELPLGPQGWLLSFTKLKITMENATDDPWRLEKGRKPWCSCYCLYRVEGQHCLFLVHNSPPSLGTQYCKKASQRQWVDRHEFQPAILQNATVDIPSRECSTDYSGGYAVCAYYTGSSGCWTELL